MEELSEAGKTLTAEQLTHLRENLDVCLCAEEFTDFQSKRVRAVILWHGGAEVWYPNNQRDQTYRMIDVDKDSLQKMLKKLGDIVESMEISRKGEYNSLTESEWTLFVHLNRRPGAHNGPRPCKKQRTC